MLVPTAVEEVTVLVVKEEVSMTIPVGKAPADEVMDWIPEVADPAKEAAPLDAAAI